MGKYGGYIIKITGLVQGIGFRPFIYRIATELAIRGTVENDSSGVIIKLNATPLLINNFISTIITEAPLISTIVDISLTSVAQFTFNDFQIIKSSSTLGFTQVSPDIGICDKCIADRKTQPHRLIYPFINCTNCGPRFSIIKKTPYDRVATTMNKFKMCNSCETEYKNTTDRRFHAQPIACNNCGPTYSYHHNSAIITNYHTVLKTIINDIESGSIVAIKGIGGYNLICDGSNEKTLHTLRQIKNRPRKPFAIMVENIDRASHIAVLNDEEIKTLTSPQRPIVILDLKTKTSINNLIAPQYRTIGIMLPYMAIHYDIFENSSLNHIVFTSGNEGDNPILIEDNEARWYFGKLNIPVISYNREIYNRIDDSVVQVIDNRVRIIRRARGYTPNPLFNDTTTDGIIGMGAEVTSHFAIGCRNQIIASQYIGNLSNYNNEQFYTESLHRFKSMFNFTPLHVVVDAHHQYRASILGKEENVNILKMWHHHAHAVAVMAEYNMHDYTLALCLDGTGLGPDNTSWGGELLSCNRTEFTRLHHLPMLPMPGGNIASIEGWRMAVAIIGDINQLPNSFIKRIGIDKITAVSAMIHSNFNSPLTSGAGRLFDAVASLLNITDINTYDAEAPILLEQIANHYCSEVYPDCSYRGIINSIISDISTGENNSIIAARFHNSFVEMWISSIIEYSTKLDITSVILCGGVFQNRLLTTRFISRIREIGLTPHFPSQIPCNDAAIPIGQVAFGAEHYKNI